LTALSRRDGLAGSLTSPLVDRYAQDTVFGRTEPQEGVNVESSLFVALKQLLKLRRDIRTGLSNRLDNSMIKQKVTLRKSWEVMTAVCTENLIRVDDVMESPKLAE
jgi:hypothetical protein